MKQRFLALAFWYLAACSSAGGGGPYVPPDPDSGTRPACVPGTTASCACPGGTSGVQTCNASGSGFGACENCTASTVDAGATPDLGLTCAAQQVLCGGACVNVQTDIANCGGCERSCGTTQVCAAGTCVAPSPDPCSPRAPAGVCPSGQTCVAGACCDAGQACGAVCCSASSVCVTFGTGNRVCAPRCTTSSECTETRCCSPLENRDVPGTLRPYGACLQFGMSGVSQCRCATGAECSGGACTPVVNAQGVPMRPYICTTPTCAPYGRCTGLGSCPNGYCNLCDTAGNCFCAQVCTSDAMCGGAQCTTYSRSIGSCPNTQRACAPR